jgi:phage I-like protein
MKMILRNLLTNLRKKKDDGSEAAQKQIEILQDAQSTVSTYADNLKDIDKQIEDKKKRKKRARS